MPEELQEAQPEEVVTEESPVETQVPEEAESVESESSEEAEAPEEEISKKVKSDRGQKRIQDLAQKAKKATDLEKEVKDLRDRLVDEPEETSKDVLEQLKSEGVPYTGDYVSDLRIAEDRGAEKALNVYRKEQATRERFASDVNSLEAEYPELRKGSESFDEDLTDELVTLYKESSNVNPNLRLKPFVTKVMKLRKQGETKGKASSVEEIVQQTSTGAVHPTTGTKRVTKDFKDMSFEELEAIVPTE